MLSTPMESEAIGRARLRLLSSIRPASGALGAASSVGMEMTAGAPVEASSGAATEQERRRTRVARELAVRGCREKRKHSWFRHAWPHASISDDQRVRKPKALCFHGLLARPAKQIREPGRKDRSYQPKTR